MVTVVPPAVGPELGETEVTAGDASGVADKMEPVTSPATHKVVTGQDTSQMTLAPLTSAVVQSGVAAAGLKVVSTSPALSVATHRDPCTCAYM